MNSVSPKLFFQTQSPKFLLWILSSVGRENWISPIEWVSARGYFAPTPQKTFGTFWRHFSYHHWGRKGIVSIGVTCHLFDIGQRCCRHLEMDRAISPPPQQRILLPKISVVARLRTSAPTELYEVLDSIKIMNWLYSPILIFLIWRCTRTAVHKTWNFNL